MYRYQKRYKGTWAYVPGNVGTRVNGYREMKVQGYISTGKCWYKIKWVQGNIGTIGIEWLHTICTDPFNRKTNMIKQYVV